MGKWSKGDSKDPEIQEAIGPVRETGEDWAEGETKKDWETGSGRESGLRKEGCKGGFVWKRCNREVFSKRGRKEGKAPVPQVQTKGVGGKKRIKTIAQNRRFNVENLLGRELKKR